MTDVGVLVALPGDVEGELVQALEGSPARVVRRCADVPEVLAAAAAGIGSLAVLATELPGVDRTVVGRLRSSGVRTVLLAPGTDVLRCAALGAEDVLPTGTSAAAIADRVVALAARPAAPPPPGDEAGGSTAGAQIRAAGPAHDDGDAGVVGANAVDRGDILEPEGLTADVPGRLVVVWGAPGAPGRTTVAVTLAAELARLRGSALLVDADTEAPSVTQTLGLLDDSSAVAALCRQAAHGLLDDIAVERLCPALDDGLRVATGLTRAGRWRELPAPALEVVFDTSRRVMPFTVVDVGATLDEDGPEQAYGPRRHQATSAALAAADVVVVVGSAEPVGMRRLVLALTELSERGVARPEARRLVVVNRVRASAAGPRPHQTVRESLTRFADVTDAVLVPDDRPAADAAMLAGLTLTRSAPASPARLAIEDLARSVAGASPSRRARPRTRRPRRARA